LWQILVSLPKIFLRKRLFRHKFSVFEKIVKNKGKEKKSPEIATTAYNMKRGCILRLFYLYILNIAKFG